jgi:hypothetical protein
MSPRNRPPRAEAYPPEWIERAARAGLDPIVWATIPAGAAHLAVWRRFQDATPQELRLACTPVSDDWPPTPDDAIARVKAMRAAQASATGADPMLAADRWEACLDFVWPQITEAVRQDGSALASRLQSLGLLQALPPQAARGLTARRIREAVAELRAKAGKAPTLDEAARALGTTESTLKRAMKDLGMGRWPPAPPEN